LIGLERDALRNSTPERREELLKRLDDIETGVNNMKVPPPFRISSMYYDNTSGLSATGLRLTSTPTPVLEFRTNWCRWGFDLSIHADLSSNNIRK
jgi:hypothetical protein